MKYSTSAPPRRGLSPFNQVRFAASPKTGRVSVAIHLISTSNLPHFYRACRSSLRTVAPGEIDTFLLHSSTHSSSGPQLPPSLPLAADFSPLTLTPPPAPLHENLRQPAHRPRDLSSTLSSRHGRSSSPATDSVGSAAEPHQTRPSPSTSPAQRSAEDPVLRESEAAMAEADLTSRTRELERIQKRSRTACRRLAESRQRC